MCDKLEQEQLELQKSRLKWDQDYLTKDFRLKCLEFARNGDKTTDTILTDAQTFLDFVNQAGKWATQ